MSRRRCSASRAPAVGGYAIATPETITAPACPPPPSSRAARRSRRRSSFRRRRRRLRRRRAPPQRDRRARARAAGARRAHRPRRRRVPARRSASTAPTPTVCSLASCRRRRRTTSRRAGRRSSARADPRGGDARQRERVVRLRLAADHADVLAPSARDHRRKLQHDGRPRRCHHPLRAPRRATLGRIDPAVARARLHGELFDALEERWLRANPAATVWPLLNVSLCCNLVARVQRRLRVTRGPRRAELGTGRGAGWNARIAPTVSVVEVRRRRWRDRAEPRIRGDGARDALAHDPAVGALRVRGRSAPRRPQRHVRGAKVAARRASASAAMSPPTLRS